MAHLPPIIIIPCASATAYFANVNSPARCASCIWQLLSFTRSLSSHLPLACTISCMWAAFRSHIRSVAARCLPSFQTRTGVPSPPSQEALCMLWCSSPSLLFRGCRKLGISLRLHPSVHLACRVCMCALLRGLILFVPIAVFVIAAAASLSLAYASPAFGKNELKLLPLPS